MTWEEEKQFLEQRGHCLTEEDFEVFMIETMSRVMTNIDDGEFERISVVTNNGTGWNFKVKKNS